MPTPVKSLIKFQEFKLEGDTTEIDNVERTLKNFILNGTMSKEIKGILQFKAILNSDINLELIPSNYLDNPVISPDQITKGMKKVFSEITFQGIKKALQNENI